MRYAIISDIHSNLEALSSFFNIASSLNIEKIISLGDLVGYYTNPNECINLLSRIKIFYSIRGNHDRVVINKKYDDFSSDAKASIKWTIKNLNNESLKNLKEIEQGPKIIHNNFAICHGSFYNEDDYILTKYEAKEEFDFLIKNNVKLGFFGHTHIQKNYCFDTKKNVVTDMTENSFLLDPEKFYLINPGSIGQPRDKNPSPSFLIYDSNKLSIEILRFDYKINITKQKVIYADLPKRTADRLSSGY
ncbi:MAG TPA: metallophosphoesterase family protein [Spirochaetota bacterium]|nr:metallophosphoesterase family protein [Spirochaetota bacterium]